MKLLNSLSLGVILAMASAVAVGDSAAEIMEEIVVTAPYPTHLIMEEIVVTAPKPVNVIEDSLVNVASDLIEPKFDLPL
ncbi:MAG: hypothetical protein JXB36_19555 [Gammaproteobacteria bacterium]|nr:hypothetical protein [Gammaproteobacteria bacterium]